MTYKDFTFNYSEYGGCTEISDTNAIINGIKNIILSRPGNYPFTPDLGVDIAKYQFDLLDEYTLSTIKTDIMRQVSKHMPTIDNVSIDVQKVEDIVNGEYKTAIGISVSAMENGEEVSGNFLIVKNEETIAVYDEIK